MNAKVCQDIFLISILAHVNCDLEINDSDKMKEFSPTVGGSYPFTVNFIYVLGTDYDVAHANFGFDSDYPLNADPLMVLQNGVSIGNETWTPQTPDVSNSPTAMQMGVYSAMLNFTSNQAAYNALVALGNVGNARINPNFGGVLVYNQGV